MRFTIEELKLRGIAINISTKDGWDHLAEDCKKGLHYYSIDNKEYFGPYRKKKHAEEARRLHLRIKSQLPV